MGKQTRDFSVVGNISFEHKLSSTLLLSWSCLYFSLESNVRSSCQNMFLSAREFQYLCLKHYVDIFVRC